MANYLRVPDSNSRIVWRRGVAPNKKDAALDFTAINEHGQPVAKAKLTAEQLHTYICLHSTMK